MESVSDQDHGADRTEHVKAETQEDKKIRITMLGISGSGKTSFLSGVYQTMIMDSFHGLSLVPSIDSRQQLSADWSDCGYCVNQPKRF